MLIILVGPQESQSLPPPATPVVRWFMAEYLNSSPDAHVDPLLNMSLFFLRHYKDSYYLLWNPIG